MRALGYQVAPEKPSDAQAQGALAHDGADAQGHDHSHDHEDHGHDHGEAMEGAWWRGRKAALTIACGLAMAAAFVAGQLFPEIGSAAFILAMLVGLVPVARRALTAATRGTPFSIEMLMTVAAVGAVFIGAAEEAAVVVFLFLVGELLEGVAAGRARASIRNLTKLVPDTALLERTAEPRRCRRRASPSGRLSWCGPVIAWLPMA